MKLYLDIDIFSARTLATEILSICNTFKYYDFSGDFSKNYADYTLELGRSFVNFAANVKCGDYSPFGNVALVLSLITNQNIMAFGTSSVRFLSKRVPTT
jgi:hypothetical protein